MRFTTTLLAARPSLLSPPLQYQTDQPHPQSVEDPYSEGAFTASRAYDSGHAASGPAQGQSVAPPPQPDVIPSGMAAVLAPKGILRIVIWFFSLLAFAIMSSFPYYESAGPFKFVIAANVLAWVYSLVLIFLYLFRKKVDTVCIELPVVEFVLDAILMVLTLIAGITAAAQCGKTYYKAACDAETTSKGGIAFSFLTSFLFMAAVFLSWKENKKLEAQHS